MKDNRIFTAKIVCVLTGIFIIAVGIWLWTNNKTTTGVLGPGRSGNMHPTTLTGLQIIVVGVIFSIVSWLAFRFMRDDK